MQNTIRDGVSFDAEVGCFLGASGQAQEMLMQTTLTAQYKCCYSSQFDFLPRTSRKEVKCIKAKDQLRAYCAYLYSVYTVLVAKSALGVVRKAYLGKKT